MAEASVYSFADAWVLTALIIMGDWADNATITATGDVLNHAILTDAEIDQAISKLTPLGYVEREGSTARATQKALALADCSAYRRAGLFTQIDVILARLSRWQDRS